jgi:putative flippase GtrA
MAIACAISYTITTQLLARFVDEPTELLGGLWAVIATVFVFRESRASSLSAGLARLIATGVSFAACLPYLLIFPFTGLGMAAAIGFGAIVMILLGRPDHIVTTGITIAGVSVVAALSPHTAWQQPFLYLLGTFIGIAIGVCCKWCASYAFSRIVGEPAR